MKVLCTILFINLCVLSVHSQNNIFVLVDVSRSVSQEELNNAKQTLNEVLTGSQLSLAFISQGDQQDLVNFKLAQGDKLSVVKFGSLHTTIAINPNPSTIQNANADIFPVLNTIVWTPTDQQTYITLAKAKIAEYAKNNNITKYKLFIISDNINDDYGPGGSPNYPDDYTRNLAEGYNTSGNPVNEAGFTKLKFSASSLFALSFSPNVDVSYYSLPGTTRPAIVEADTDNAVISLTSPPKATRGKEHEIKTETLNVNWTCNNCPQGIKYTVMVSQYDGGKFKGTQRDLAANAATFKVPNGKFRITVSSLNYLASSDNTYIKVSTGAYGWFIFILILIVSGSVSYYFWNKKRQEKIEVSATNKADDIFSRGNRGTPGNSSNSDYF